jgi:hypothetical protein
MDSLAQSLGLFFHWSLEAGTPAAYLIFGAFAGVIGAAVVLLDACSVSLGGDSYLRITHGWRATPKAVIIWVIGAMIASAVGLAVRVFEPTPLAAVFPALAWRTFIRHLQALTRRDHEDEQTPSGD